MNLIYGLLALSFLLKNLMSFVGVRRCPHGWFVVIIVNLFVLTFKLFDIAVALAVLIVSAFIWFSVETLFFLERNGS